MLKKNSGIGEMVAQGMQETINSSEHTKLFYKKAEKSACCECKSCDDKCCCNPCQTDCKCCVAKEASLQDWVEKFNKISGQLDDLGFSKVAIDVMQIADAFVEEFANHKLAFDDNDVSDEHYDALQDLVSKYPEFKRPAKAVLNESPLGEVVGPESVSVDTPTEFLMTEAPPSSLAEELPIIPPPTSVDAFLKADEEAQLDELIRQIDETQIDIKPDDITETKRPGANAKRAFLQSAKELNDWKMKYAELDELEEEDFDPVLKVLNDDEEAIRALELDQKDALEGLEGDIGDELEFFTDMERSELDPDELTEDDLSPDHYLFEDEE